MTKFLLRSEDFFWQPSYDDGIPDRSGPYIRAGRWWIHEETGELIPIIAGGTNVFAITQAGYRWGADDGTEAAHTLLGDQSTPLAMDVSGGNVDRILRILINETGAGAISGATTDDYQLQYSKNGGAFTNVTTSSSNVQAFASANLTDAGTTTERVTGGGGSFVSGEISEDGLVDDRQLTANNHMELVYTVRLVAADLAQNDALTFRVLLNGATTNVTYTVTPTANIAVSRALSLGALVLVGLSIGIGFQAPTTGDHLFTGAAPSVSVGGGNETTIPVPAGSLTSTGYVLDGIHFLGANTGAITLAGQAPVLAYTAPLGVGSVISSGAAAPLAFASTLPAGTVTAAGLAAVASVNVNTPLDVGAVLSSGLAPSLNVGLALPVPAGTVATSGLASSLAFVLPATVGTATFTGLEPSISGALSVTVPVGTATFSGLAPSLSLVMPVGLGTVTATGQAPALLTGVRLALDVGAASFSGQSPALLGSGGISPSAGALVLSGQAPTALLAYRLETGLGTVALTGLAPTVTVTQYVSLGVGSVVLSGLAPDASGAVTRALGLGQAVFSGQVPGLVTGKVELPTGALLLTGYAPATLFTSTPVDTIVVRARVDTITVTPSGLTITARAVTDTVLA